MSTGNVYSSDVTFTPAVKAVQTRKGSRAAFGRIATLQAEIKRLRESNTLTPP